MALSKQRPIGLEAARCGRADQHPARERGDSSERARQPDGGADTQRDSSAEREASDAPHRRSQQLHRARSTTTVTAARPVGGRTSSTGSLARASNRRIARRASTGCQTDRRMTPALPPTHDPLRTPGSGAPRIASSRLCVDVLALPPALVTPSLILSVV